MLIGIVGLNGSGKEETARYLVMHYNFLHRDLGQEIRDELKRMGRDFLNRDEMYSLGNERRKEFGPSYWCRLALSSVNSDNLVITSIRNIREVDEILSREGVIVEVFADQKIRFERTVERVKKDPTAHGDVKSFEYFKEKEEKDLRSEDPSKMQLLECIKVAKYRLDNNGSLDVLHGEADALMKKLGVGRADLPAASSKG